MSKKPPRVVTYSRCSTDHHQQDPRLQVEELRRYCTSRGFEIVEEVIDHGFGGANPDRPGLKKVMALVRSRKVDAVIVLNLSRLGRSLKHLIATLEEFQALGVTFISLKEQIDYSTAIGRMFVQIIGSLNEFTRELIRENTLLGLEHARRKGKRLGRPRRHDPEAIRRLRAQGRSYREISSELRVPLGCVSRALRGERKSGSDGHKLNQGKPRTYKKTP